MSCTGKRTGEGHPDGGPMAKEKKKSVLENPSEDLVNGLDIAFFYPCLENCNSNLEGDDLKDYEIFLGDLHYPSTDSEKSKSSSSQDNIPAKTRLRGGQLPCPHSIGGILHKYPEAWQWNGPPSQAVYQAFKIKPYIMHAQHILNPRKQENLIQEILVDSTKWQPVALKLLPWLEVFNNCEKLPNVLGDESEARSILKIFKSNIDKLTRKLARKPSPEFTMTVIQMFRQWSLQMEAALTNQEFAEIAFLKYIDALITIFYYVMGAPKFLYPTDLTAEVTCSPGHKKILNVNADFALSRLDDTFYHSKIVAVGEVKPFNNHEYLRHRGHRPQLFSLSEKDANALSDGQSAKDTESSSDEVTESIEQKSNEELDEESLNEKPSQSLDSNEEKSLSIRELDSKEDWRLRGILPELFAEMIAAIHTNGGQPTSQSGNFNNFMYGMAVTGLKLRFATLAIRDKDMKEKIPSYDSIYKPSSRCDIFLTQEFNLFKKEHVFMFFQVLFCLTTNA